jgi:hypothetical protein
LGGNHLLKNLKALVIGSLFFEQTGALRKWEKLLWEQFGEQVLEDGGHYERAPMYHAQALADLLECYALLEASNHFPPSGAVKRGLVSMAHFLEAMSFPDGAFALFNDSACTEETEPPFLFLSAKAICGYAPGASPGEKMGNFPETGYYVWASPDRNEKIVVDAGPPSVDYNPGHAHCDLLSYELSLFGEMFIVDSGVHGYGGDLFREYSRSTRAHNTVMVDGIEQSRPWSVFRMAQRARLAGSKPAAVSEGGAFKFEGEYRRYNRGIAGRFDRSVNHRRFITRISRGEWMIEDIVTRGKIKQVASSFVHLHPAWVVKKQETLELNKKRVICESGGHRVLIESFAEELIPDVEEDVSITILRGEQNPIQGWYFPDFGDAIPSYTIRFDYYVKAGDKFGYRIKIIS